MYIDFIFVPLNHPLLFVIITKDVTLFIELPPLITLTSCLKWGVCREMIKKTFCSSYKMKNKT
nr:hypothetical protein [Bacillus sp. NP247]